MHFVLVLKSEVMGIVTVRGETFVAHIAVAQGYKVCVCGSGLFSVDASAFNLVVLAREPGV